MARRSKRRKWDPDHQDAELARRRITSLIDDIDPGIVVSAVKRAPSLRGMLLGYIAEELFEKNILRASTAFSDIVKYDDHDRTKNKVDREFKYRDRRYTVQIKSVQTDSITWSIERGCLTALVQNDASDSREIKLEGDRVFKTTAYKAGDYDILAVPLYPFTGSHDFFAYKRNRDCQRSTYRKYPEDLRAQLLAGHERIFWPLTGNWFDNLEILLDDTLGVPA